MVSRYKAPQLGRVYVAQWLTHLDMSQQQLADRMETDKANVSRWISEPWRMNLDVLSGIATAMDIEVADLFRPPETVLAEARALKRLRELREDPALDVGEQ